MSIKEIYNVILVKLRIRKVLPAAFINKQKCVDCKEPLRILEDDNINNCSGEILYGRLSVVKKIKQVAELLKPKGFALLIFELYRNMDKQHQMRNVQKDVLQQQFPNYTEQQIVSLLNRRISFENGGHQTGGAVDLTICTTKGEPLDMGTSYLEFNAATPTHNSQLTIEQKKNRALLLSVMKKVGFVNYPLEWWHFSYGDKMWAAYSNSSMAIYGNI